MQLIKSYLVDLRKIYKLRIMKTEKSLKEEYKVITKILKPNPYMKDSEIKKFEEGSELDILCNRFINRLGGLTQVYGFECVIEDVEMDLWKTRIWNVVEKAGLLND